MSAIPTEAATRGTRVRESRSTPRHRVFGTRERVLLSLAGCVLCFLIWQAALSVGLLSRLTVPPPLSVFKRLFELLGQREFLSALGDTLSAWGLALGLTTVIMVPVGLLIGTISFLNRPANTLIHAARSIPGTALIPIAILMFGLGTQMKVVVACYAIAWPLVLNSMYGVRATEPRLIQVAQTLRWSKAQVLRRVVLPSAVPFIVTGIRLAAAISLIVVVSSEFLGANTGIGTIVIRYQNATPPLLDYVYAGILVIGLVGTVGYYVLSECERRFLPWANAVRS